MENDNENAETQEIEGVPIEPDEEENANPQLEPLLLGAPFAFEGGCSLIKQHGGKPAAAAIVQCENCGQIFRCDLLDGAYKQCPKCNESYTHALIVARKDDDQVFDECLEHILIVNKAVEYEHENEDDSEIIDARQEDDIPDAQR